MLGEIRNSRTGISMLACPLAFQQTSDVPKQQVTPDPSQLVSYVQYLHHDISESRLF